MSEQEEKFPAFEDEQGKIKVLDGKTISKGNGWWSAVVFIETYGKLQFKLYLWQQKQDKNNPAVSSWKRKQSWTVNPFNWKDTTKTIDEFLEKRKTTKPTGVPS